MSGNLQNVLQQAKQLNIQEQLELIQQIAVNLQLANSSVSQDEPSEHRQKIASGFGIWKGKIWMADDFDAPLEDLQEYM